MPGTPPLVGPFVGPFRGLVHRVQEWPVASQQVARRNAMIAATDCAERRAQRQEVADYLASDAPPTTSGSTASHRSSHA